MQYPTILVRLRECRTFTGLIDGLIDLGTVAI
jgi:hypothetical protein